METMTFDTTMWGLLLQSDFMTMLVLGSLFVLSIFCWAIVLYKYILLRIKVQQCTTVLQSLRSVQSLNQLYSVVALHAKTVPGYLIAQFLVITKKVKEQNTQDGFDVIEQHGAQVLEDLMHKEQSYVSVLSMAAAVSPLLGLFGTVWGLIHSFLRIAQKQSADIVTVAPGISEALITTLAGLMVAIPALMLFYYIQNQIRSVEHALYQIADKTMVLLKLYGNQTAQDTTLHSVDMNVDVE
jgi:biopolymer transport protein TolQ